MRDIIIRFYRMICSFPIVLRTQRIDEAFDEVESFFCKNADFVVKQQTKRGVR